MLTTQLLLLIAVVFGFILFAAAYFLSAQLKNLKKDLKSTEGDALIQWLKEMKTSVEHNSDVLERQLGEQRTTLEDQLKTQRVALNQQTKLIWERLDNASEVIKTVQHQLGGIQEFGKDIKDLSNVLKSPKLRGGLGEQFLYEILEAIIPRDLFKTQYKFKDGSICDAVVHTDRGIIPIDSKFPMENFRAMATEETPEARDRFKKAFIADVKKRIDEISKKYIVPEEGTTGQAIMYIPSENVYYELIVNTPQIEEYAKQNNIVMASPNTLSYFLKVLLVAYQQHELQKHTHEILKALAGVKVEAAKFNEDLDVLGRHITNSFKAMETVKGKFGRLFGKIEGVQSIEEPDQKKLLE